MEKVYLVACGQYDPRSIESGVRAALEGLGIALPDHGECLLHVACPWAHPRFAPASHTHPSVIEGVARALSGTSIVLGGNSLPGFPTRYGFGNAGYFALARRLGARLAPFDEIGAATAGRASNGQPVLLPAPRLTPSFTVSLPKLTGSTHVPFAGALRHQFSRLPQPKQVADQHRLPEKVVDLLPVAQPELIVVDAVQAMHRGGELSGEPVELGMLIVGTNPVAVDLVCAAAFGLLPAEVDFLQVAAQRGLGPAGLDEIAILGDLDLAEVRSRGGRVQLVDPNPENYPLPPQVKVARSAKARVAGTAGGLTETFLMLERAGIGLDRARETTLVVGQVAGIPRGKSDYATLIFLDDTSRGEYEGYSRVVRLQGRNAPVSRLLQDVPFAMAVANVRAELGGGFVLAGLRAGVSRLTGRLAGRGRATLPPAGVQRR